MEYFPLVLKTRLSSNLGIELDTIDEIIHTINQEYSDPLYEPHIFCHGDCYDEECLYEQCRNVDLRKLGKWIVRKIILDTHADTRTIGVRLRIATGILNKIDLKTGGNDLKITLQYNFVQNVQSVLRQKFAYDLPFQFRIGVGEISFNPLWIQESQHQRSS